MVLKKVPAMESLPLRIVCFNIRYATDEPVQGEELWSVRRHKVCAQFRFLSFGHYSVFICLQEALHSQVLDISRTLGPSWSYIGRGREDGKEAGEYCPVFFRADSWECTRSKMYWLSDTPDVPSRGWDAVLERVVTIGSFRHRASGLRLVMMSTHFDHVGVLAREESAKLILKLARAWTEEDALCPVFLGGDLNSTPDGVAYQTFTRQCEGMKDVSDLLSEEHMYGNKHLTYTSFGEPGGTPSRIDFVFVQDPSKIRCTTYAVLSNRFDDGIYLSDHRPICVDVEVPADVGQGV